MVLIGGGGRGGGLRKLLFVGWGEPIDDNNSRANTLLEREYEKRKNEREGTKKRRGKQGRNFLYSPTKTDFDVKK